MSCDENQKDRDRRKQELETQEWFHGFRPRKDITVLLQEPGDFLMRATDARNHPEIVISFMNDLKEMVTLTVIQEKNKWQLGVMKNRNKVAPGFDSIVELVEHYKLHKLPGKAKLKKGIPRPSWLIKHNKVEFDRTKDLLGSGNFCHVFKGTYTRSADDKITVAVKICHEGNASDKNFEEGKEARNAMIGEAHMMSYYTHKHVIQLYGVACDHPPILIVMEYCPGGNLEHHLKASGDKIEVGERLMYLFEAARGMRYLHSKHCVHRDLASRNCLISARGKIKIADFGLSQLVQDLDMGGEKKEEDEKEKKEKKESKKEAKDKGSKKEKEAVSKDPKEDEQPKKPAGQIPLRWMAPESLKKPFRYSTRSDVWSFGVLIYEVFNNGVKPWPDEPNKKIATWIRKGNMPTMPPKTPPEITDLTKQIWVVDETKRLKMGKIAQEIYLLNKRYKPPPAAKLLINNIAGVDRSKESVDETVEMDDDTPHRATTQDTIERAPIETVDDHSMRMKHTVDKDADATPKKGNTPKGKTNSPPKKGK